MGRVALTPALLNAKINLKRDMEASVDQDDSFVRVGSFFPCQWLRSRPMSCR